jgi:putative NIF3 family GTP cyclohydrolase 1 type 2
MAGDGSVDVKGIAVAWWLTPDLLETMEAEGLNLGLTHERPIFELPARFVWGLLPPEAEIPANRRIREVARRAGMAIHQFHSNIDKATWGMAPALFVRLGWQDYPADWSRGVPVIDLPPRPLRELVEELKAKLEIPFVRYDGDLDRTVRRAACAWGGLCQGWAAAACALPLGFDVLIGGDIIDGVVRLARAEGWAVIDAMHHATEMDGMRVLTRKLEARFPRLPVRFYENDCPWQVL